MRKDLTYACREERQCLIDKRQRNRCQYCRYQKCLQMGMKREAVQEERQRNRDRGGGGGGGASGGSSSSAALLMDPFDPDASNGAIGPPGENGLMPIERILEAEKRVECRDEPQVMSNAEAGTSAAMSSICQATDKQLFQLVEWAKHIPHFTELPLDDQVVLLRAGWNELLIAAFSHRSVGVKDGIVLATGLVIHRHSAHQAGVGTIFDRVLTELVSKMREMKLDLCELGCLRAIILFNPDAKGLKTVRLVESLREKVYASLEEYTRSSYGEEPGRFAKLLLRLPALRSIGLKCLEHLFFFKLIGDTPIESFLLEMLEAPAET